MVQKSEKIEMGQDFAANQDLVKPTVKEAPVDMVDVSKELNLTLDDVDTKIRSDDPEWKRK